MTSRRSVSYGWQADLRVSTALQVKNGINMQWTSLRAERGNPVLCNRLRRIASLPTYVSRLRLTGSLHVVKIGYFSNFMKI